MAINSPTATNEGDAGTGFIDFTVTRSDTSGSPTATYTITNGTTDATDFGPGFTSTGTVTFASGSTTALISVPIKGDVTPENNETFSVTLSNPTMATITTAAGTGTILNDDATYTLSNLSTLESNNPVGTFGVTVTRDAAHTGFATTIYAQLVSGTAIAGSDFIGGVVPVSFAAGASVSNITIGILGDTVVESDETFTINLFNDSALTIARGSATATILNDDALPTGYIKGTSGNDLVYSTGLANETLDGGAGDDRYVVGSYGDQIVEGAGSGYDTVYSSMSYALNGGAQVESLSTQTHAGTESINLIGNFYSQLIIGNNGDNVLNGNGGADTLIGLKGNDTYVVGDANAQIIENVGEGYDVAYVSVSYTLGAGVSVDVLSTQTAAGIEAINLTGNSFAQLVIGNQGSNVLNGGGGSDTLQGLGGADTFAFSTALGNGNIVTIADFGNGADKIQLSSGVFGGMASGTLAASNFVVGSAAATPDQHIVYNQATGQLFYDADGSGAGAAVLFAAVTPGAVIAANMITVV